jgi:hypothetical protein
MADHPLDGLEPDQEWRRAIHVTGNIKLVEDGDDSDRWQVYVWQGRGGLGWSPVGKSYDTPDKAMNFINSQRSGERPL